MHTSLYFFLSIPLLFGLPCSAKPLDRRVTLDTMNTENGTPMGLYAYGDGIYGVEIFYEAGGTIRIGSSQSKAAIADGNMMMSGDVRIEHNDPTTPSIWKVGPSSASASSRARIKRISNINANLATQAFANSNGVLALTSSSDPINDVIFADPNTPGLLTKKTSVPGVYKLRWTTKRTLPADHILIRLRTIKPSTDFTPEGS